MDLEFPFHAMTHVIQIDADTLATGEPEGGHQVAVAGDDNNNVNQFPQR